MSYIAEAKMVAEQVDACRKLRRHLQAYCSIPVCNFDEHAAVKFQNLRRAKTRVGTTDLKIAAIAIFSKCNPTLAKLARLQADSKLECDGLDQVTRRDSS